jgi:hypothetical protein
MNNEILNKLVPIFVIGINFTQISENRFFIGNHLTGNEIIDKETALILNAIDGQTNLEVLAQIQNTDGYEIFNRLLPYINLGYIKLTKSNINQEVADLIKRNHLMQSEQGEAILNERIKCELPGVMVQPKLRLMPSKNLAELKINENLELARTSHYLNKLFARSNFQIMIFGPNRSTLNLFGILQTLGFAKTKVMSGFNAKATVISNSDICGASVRTHDHGLEFEIRKEQIKQEQSLFRFDLDSHSGQMNKPDLIISFVPVPPDYQQRWLCESTPHLVIGAYLNGQVTLGPLVIPGSSPCLNCQDLNNRQFSPGKAEIEINCLNFDEANFKIPSAQLWVVLGKLAIAISEWADTQSSSLVATQCILDFRNYQSGAGLDQVTRVLPLSFNSMCGCRQIP